MNIPSRPPYIYTHTTNKLMTFSKLILDLHTHKHKIVYKTNKTKPLSSSTKTIAGIYRKTTTIRKSKEK